MLSKYSWMCIRTLASRNRRDQIYLGTCNGIVLSRIPFSIAVRLEQALLGAGWILANEFFARNRIEKTRDAMHV